MTFLSFHIDIYHISSFSELPASSIQITINKTESKTEPHGTPLGIYLQFGTEISDKNFEDHLLSRLCRVLEVVVSILSIRVHKVAHQEWRSV